MANALPPPTGDAKNPPNEPVGWGKLFNWFYLLWKSVTNLTFGADPSTYSAAVFSTIGQADTGSVGLLGQSAFLFVRGQTAQAIATSSETAMTNWTSAVFAPVGAFVASTGAYTVSVPGVYFASVTVSYQANTNWALSAVSAVVRLNGTNVADCFERCNLGASSQAVQPPPAIWVGYLNAGDVITAATFQNSGFSQNTEGAHSNYTIVRIAP